MPPNAADRRGGDAIAGVPGPGAWTNRTSSVGDANPGVLGDGGVAYDASDGYVLLYGGLIYDPSNGVAPTQATWRYANGNWTHLGGSLNYTQPTARWGIQAGMTYDVADGYVLLFGGENATGGVFGDTWAFSAGHWTQLFPNVSPPARTWPSLAYDGADACTLLFGGATTQGGGYLNDTWCFRNGTWTEILPASGALWPEPRRDGKLVYDPLDGYTVLFGGQGTSGDLNDTWTFLGGRWSLLAPPTSPPSRFLAGMTYDVRYQYVFLLGGWADPYGSGLRRDNWAFRGGVWQELDQNFALEPAPAGALMSTWDGADRSILVYGTSPMGDLGNETWTYDWPLSVLLRPWDFGTEVGLPSRVDALARGGSLSYTTAFAVTNGTCAARNASEVACTLDLPGPAIISVHANDSVGDLATDVLNLTAVPALAVSVQSSVVANATDVGLPVSLTARVAGGFGPFSLTWSGLPDGCSPGYGIAVACLPRTAGASAPTVTVHDALGAVRAAALVLEVHDLIRAAPYAVASDTGCGRIPSEELVANASGGTGALDAHWNFGDGDSGVGTFTSHVYPVPGNFTAHVVVTDSLNVSGGANLSLQVPLVPCPLAVVPDNARTDLLVVGAFVGSVVVVTVLGLRLARRIARPPGSA